MRYVLRLLFLLISLGGVNCLAQETPLEEEALEEYSVRPLDEALIESESGTTLILDNSRTKVGRDFYEEFYRQWTSAQLDSTSMGQMNATFEQNIDELTVKIEELPSIGLSNIIEISVGDQIVWQQFVQPRLEILEAQAENAAQTVLQYLVNYQLIQSQLGTEDQMGTGIY
ncbi:hypothetical protein GCM10027275_06450 [Rhabdobacter roseus]|uniref:Curli production assembly/transport component CsgE n=1 Tax=Rhabdobacter roseus TaxID=1655419 RepID=A0A840TH25_9BACT|nr:CsgE family curli-type amyloid fiber assembly protein [Rhabdobacter roseus]MBB5282541.1 curli production assembly/transport component CsgE [Rhabdobacter roseus]